MSKTSSLYCFHLPARQLKRKYATPKRCRNYKSIQECSVHGDIHLFASVEPTAECHSLQDESSSQWWSQGTDARTWLTSWHLHFTSLYHKAEGCSYFEEDVYQECCAVLCKDDTHNSLFYPRHVVVSAVKEIEKSIVHYNQVCGCRLQNRNGLYGCSEVKNFPWYSLFLFNFHT